MKNNEAFNKAMDRIRDEMAKESSHPGIQFIGGWLTGQLTQQPKLAEKLMDEKKSVKGAFEQIRSYASKHKTGNFAFVPPEKAIEIVGEYYRIETQALGGTPQAAGGQLPSAEGSRESTGLDLDDLLGGL